MAVSPVSLRALLERAFPEAAVALKDFIGDDNHFPREGHFCLI